MISQLVCDLMLYLLFHWNTLFCCTPTPQCLALFINQKISKVSNYFYNRLGKYFVITLTQVFVQKIKFKLIQWIGIHLFVLKKFIYGPYQSNSNKTHWCKHVLSFELITSFSLLCVLEFENKKNKTVDSHFGDKPQNIKK